MVLVLVLVFAVVGVLVHESAVAQDEGKVIIDTQQLPSCSDLSAMAGDMVGLLEAHGAGGTYLDSIAHTKFSHDTPNAGPLDLAPLQRVLNAMGCQQTQSLAAAQAVVSGSAVAGAPRRNRREVADIHSQCVYTTGHELRCEGLVPATGLTITFQGRGTLPSDTQRPVPVMDASVSVQRLTLTGELDHNRLRSLLFVGNWTSVETLSLSGLQFVDFSLAMLNGFAALRTLQISDTLHLQLDARDFALAPQLLRLELAANGITDLRPDVFAGLSALSVLNLANNRLTAVPSDALRPLRSLTQLHLNDNPIVSVDPGAFRALTALTFLSLWSADISSIANGTFQGLARLSTLRLSNNPLRTVEAGAFQPLTMLYSLHISTTELTTLPSGLFVTTTRLSWLDLRSNRLQSLPPDAFQGLQSLTLLFLSSNRLTALPAGLFAGLHQLSHLEFSSNRVGQLHSRLFSPLSKLQTLRVSRNGITQLPRDVFAPCTALTALHLDFNPIRALPDGVFEHLTQLQRLWFQFGGLTSVAPETLQGLVNLQELLLSGHQLTTFEATLPSLVDLNLNYNPLQRLPDVSSMPALEDLYLTRHHITHMDLTHVLSLRNITALEAEAAQGVECTATLQPTQVIQRQQQQQQRQNEDRVVLPLLGLVLLNVDAGDVLKFLVAHADVELATLEVGWPGLTQDTVTEQDLCSLLADNVARFVLSNTGYTHLTLCRDKIIDAVAFVDNKQLATVTAHNSLAQLNLAGCEQLTRLDAQPTPILDISRTRLQPDSMFCSTLGHRAFVAQGMPTGWREHAQLDAMLAKCLATVDILDLAENTWLDQPQRVNEVAAPIQLLNNRLRNERDHPPALELHGTRIQCPLGVNHRGFVFFGNVRHDAYSLHFSLNCTCALGFKLSAGRCVRDVQNVAEIAAPSVIGGLLFGLLMAWLSRRYRGLTKRIGLQEQLLVERDEEVMALKQAWEVEYGELRMIKRVAAGAFGVVFKAEWDTVMVAVKVLQQAVMAFDESTVLEFKKEVEFLQKTRHPNVVRFFGAGTDPNGSPFLVLEFVAMGSLKDLLQKDMEEVLMGVEQGANGGTDASVIAEDFGEELTLVSTGRDKRDETTTAWDLKLRLLRDVASGMAFIHSLDQMHRSTPEWFQSLTHKCMAQDPRERPSFGELKDHHLV
ncbi:TKL protein kinase [Salpingoeca rosetta]|uniref:TKL protein kinase n=1 Tax=Salpingoeca rosetta (strain ATCC 50818 / BSB-021) TaxID=946362 RepID=F2UMW4_SALR5|nr:TKL protein kinase [Salpingoeca rosetta]EGD78463.1 TKL protein kinase [Salpingoeca rosetta]|eukprot:XP_004989412.1 TKL protein kinase [Salpingoeca rosetta]